MQIVNLLSLTCFSLMFLQTLASFEQEVLDKHNSYRAKHAAGKLALDDALSAACKNYAKELAELGKLQHSQGDFGENLCMTTADPVSCVKNWYDEVKDYDFNKAQFSMETGHFTQLVWRATTTLGVGTHRANGRNYVVARYKPPGNVSGAFRQNVKRAGSGCVESSIYLVIMSAIFLLPVSIN